MRTNLKYTINGISFRIADLNPLFPGSEGPFLCLDLNCHLIEESLFAQDGTVTSAIFNFYERKDEITALLFFSSFEHYVLQGHPFQNITCFYSDAEIQDMLDKAFLLLGSEIDCPYEKNVAAELIAAYKLHKIKKIQQKVKKETTSQRRKEFNSKRNQILLKLIASDGYMCAICESTDDITIDHVVALSKGGSDELENLRLLCRSCNSAKGDS